MVNEEFYTFEPDYVVLPGDTLSDTIEAMGISQAELARRTGRPAKTINGIIKGHVAITPETSLQLEKVLGVPSSFWINLESSYRQDLAKIKEEESLARSLDWLEKFPISHIIEMGFMEKEKNKIEQFKELLKFFGVASMKSWDEVWNPKVAFRKSNAFETDLGAISAWVRMIEIEANKINCKPYSKKTFQEKLMEIRELTTESKPDIFIEKLTELCSEAGVAVVFLPEVPGCRASGVTKWLNPKKAMIGLSLRYKTNDHLWFTFFHEAGHILLHEKKTMFIEGISDEELTAKEEEANKFAADFLIPPKQYNEFTSRKPISAQRVLRFSEELGIAPAIIVGRLQREGFINYSHLNRFKVRYTWK